jgi:multidrug efflux pump subunit AcrA (membrane-fusion protein)
MNKRLAVAGCLLVATVALAVFFAGRWLTPAAPLLVEVGQRPFVETIDLRGHVEPLRYEDVRAPNSSTERQVIELAPEGALVKAGDVVAQFDPGPLLLYIDVLKERLRDMEMSREDLETLMNSRIFESRVGVQSSQESLALAEIRKQALLYESGLNQARTSVEVNIARQKVKNAMSTLGQTGRQKETRVAYRVEDAERFLDKIREIEAQLEGFTAKAPTDSIVVYPPIPVAGDMRKVETGDFLERGQSFMMLPDLGSLVVRAYLEEAQMERVKQGMTVSISPVAFPGTILPGVVESVSPVPEILPERGGRKFFSATIRIQPSDRENDLKVGMVVGISIRVKDYGKVFAIPRDLAAFRDGHWLVKQMREGAGLGEVPLADASDCGDFLIIPRWPGAPATVTLVYEPAKKF